MVFVHGINGGAEQWQEVVARLEPSRNAFAIDLRGHGSSARAGPFGVADYVDDVLALLGEVKAVAVHVVGTSFGGAVAAGVGVARATRVASIAAIGSALSTGGVGTLEDRLNLLREVGVREFFRQRLPLVSFGPNTSADVVARAVDVASSGRDVETVAAVLQSGFTADNSSLFGAVRSPALVCTGEYDRTCPIALGESLAAALRTTLVVLPSVGHMAILEDPSIVAAALSHHFAKYDPAAGGKA